MPNATIPPGRPTSAHARFAPPNAGRRSRTVALAGLIAALSVVFGAASASATGYGLYIDYALGPLDLDGFPPLEDRLFSVGGTFDTAVARDKLYNYRFNLGYEREKSSAQGGALYFNNATLEQVFGFGVYRTRLMRVWLGPAIRLSGGVLDKSASNTAVPGTVVKVTAGGGISLGINVHTGRIGSAAFTLGYQFAYAGLFSANDALGSDPYRHGRVQRVNFNFAYYFRGAGDQFD